MPDGMTCACAPDADGIYETAGHVCDQHRMRMYQFEWEARRNLDAELDNQMQLMFGKRNLARSLVPVGNFEVKR